MKKIFFLISTLVFLSNFSVSAQENPVKKSRFLTVLGSVAQNLETAHDSQIKNIQSFGANSGIVYTSDAIFRTDDGGTTWRKLSLSNGLFGKISSVYFENETKGFAVSANPQNASVSFAKTFDGGNSWTKTPINLNENDLREAELENATLENLQNGKFRLTFRLPTSSNFVGQTVYESANEGNDWSFVSRSVEIRREDEIAEKLSGNWVLKQNGSCESGKVGCVQENIVFANGKDITPAQIKELTRTEKEKAKTETRKSMFTAAPGGNTRISLDRGFDKCTAAPASQMQLWWDNSPHYIANIYISGRNRGCSQPQLTANWVNQVANMGWGLIPTIVGYQSPCTASTTSQKLSYDVAVAEQQGRGEADIAIADANNLGLTQGTVLYYDMERYDETASTVGCRVATSAFLKGWTDRVKELGYISGVYGSPNNAVADWINLPPASRMDAIWMARWDNVASVWTYASPSPVMPTNVWNNHQRIKQWQAPHNETWGGVTFNIDGNIADGPVAGNAIAKNKQADFDGDGKTDVSVFRPSTGDWFVLKSANSSFYGVAFGNSTDIAAPADYDGDGKTDTAVFRPSDGTWYMLGKANTFSSRTFGTNGDIPAPADYNGDGKADFAVFRPSNGTWYIANTDSLNTLTVVQFGANGDKPAIGDYDGDGKSDIAVWRASVGDWYILRSSDNSFFGANFGISTDLPAQGDFDGDSKTDLAVYRSGTWYILQSTAGFTAASFGTNGDLPVTGDFDGDNKADVSVFRTSTGAWYLLQSTAGFNAVNFGANGDKPIPNAYLPQ
ncbi:MAG TPA: DUF1906 domain-containing protein [Pyrinomonadaceae bacterium]|nr:DUF1906 domain-containing protein [Pyrinomonadaceae bacterium]